MIDGNLTKAALVEEVAHAADLTKKRAEIIVDTLFGSIAAALHHGERVEFRGSVTSEPGEHSEHLPLCERADDAALRAPAARGRGETPQLVAGRLGELLPPGTGQAGLRGD